MKIYFSIDNFIRDLPNIKDEVVGVTKDFQYQTSQLRSYEYRSILNAIKRQNIKFRTLEKEEVLEYEKSKRHR